jgi:acyl-CoA reductase-like NAD-dependent aldehyde dehydrogenase
MTTQVSEQAMLIDGEWVAASDGGCFDSINPATGEVWARIPAATAEDVYRAGRQNILLSLAE